MPASGSVACTWVPSLILQPLVENAVTHGLADHSGRVTVRVEVATSEGGLMLRVVNTTAPEGGRRRDGVGLRNVRERLAVQFGRRAAFDAGPSGAGTWTAEIRIPLLEEAPRS